MRRATKLVITIVTVVFATATFAGLASAGETLTKSQYLKKANSICKAGNKEINAIVEETFAGLDEGEEPSDAQIEETINEVVPIFRGVLDDIRALEGPKALDKKVDALADQYETALDEIEADPVAAFAGEQDPFVPFDKKARKLGLKTCAQS